MNIIKKFQTQKTLFVNKFLMTCVCVLVSAVRDIMLNKKDDNDNTISDEGIVTDQTSLVSSRRSSVESLKDKGPGEAFLKLCIIWKLVHFY